MSEGRLGASLDPASPAQAPLAPVGLYVHVPFCVSVCPYCDFVVVGGAETRGPRSRVTPFVAALRAEIGLRADALDRWPSAGRAPLATVYLGGGTPSLLGPGVIGELLALIHDRFGIAPDAEITLEANPGPDERGDARAWRAVGITRISYGAQAMSAPALRRLGRRHSPTDVGDAVVDARSAGIPSVNLDLLYDVPDQGSADWEVDLEAGLALEPDHLSLYALGLDDPDAEGLTGTGGDHLPVRPGARAWRERARSGQDEERAAHAYGHAVRRLAAAGFRGYEISNWARPGHESRHNLAYWRRRPVEAVGPGAHAFDGAARRWNAARLDTYISTLATGSLPPGGMEAVEPATATVERVLLGLRLDVGLPAADLVRPPLAAHAAWALDRGLLERTAGDRIVLTTSGRLLSNELFARLV